MRLGAWDTPPRDIITHPFFRDLNWEELEQKRVCETMSVFSFFHFAPSLDFPSLYSSSATNTQ